MKKVWTMLGVLLLVAAACAVTYAVTVTELEAQYALKMEDTAPIASKLDEIESYLADYFIDDYDPEALSAAAADGAASAMIAATGDQWSYYISADDMQAHNEQVNNAYVGVGIVIQVTDDGMKVTSVTAGGPAEAAGVQPEDLLVAVDGQATEDLTLDETKNLVRGEAGTEVALTFVRDGETLEMTLTRSNIISPVATSDLLDDGIGLITIENFDAHCAEQTLACVDSLVEQGAKAILFDVRFNPGGYKDEMVTVLDALLPEGDIFRSIDYAGREEVDRSDDNCLDLPMAVLVNEDSYSAAEFFAAALQEYGVAEVVGMPTSGKGNFQYTFTLSDGSAIAISVGKYFTPQGKSLTDVGITPDVEVDLSYADYEALYYGTLDREDDEQMQSALEILREKIA